MRKEMNEDIDTHFKDLVFEATARFDALNEWKTKHKRILQKDQNALASALDKPEKDPELDDILKNLKAEQANVTKCISDLEEEIKVIENKKLGPLKIELKTNKDILTPLNNRKNDLEVTISKQLTDITKLTDEVQKISFSDDVDDMITFNKQITAISEVTINRSDGTILEDINAEITAIDKKITANESDIVSTSDQLSLRGEALKIHFEKLDLHIKMRSNLYDELERINNILIPDPTDLTGNTKIIGDIAEDLQIIPVNVIKYTDPENELRYNNMTNDKFNFTKDSKGNILYNKTEEAIESLGQEHIYIAGKEIDLGHWDDTLFGRVAKKTGLLGMDRPILYKNSAIYKFIHEAARVYPSNGKYYHDPEYNYPSSNYYDTDVNSDTSFENARVAIQQDILLDNHYSISYAYDEINSGLISFNKKAVNNKIINVLFNKKITYNGAPDFISGKHSKLEIIWNKEMFDRRRIANYGAFSLNIDGEAPFMFVGKTQFEGNESCVYISRTHNNALRLFIVNHNDNLYIAHNFNTDNNLNIFYIGIIIDDNEINRHDSFTLESKDKTIPYLSDTQQISAALRENQDANIHPLSNAYYKNRNIVSKFNHDISSERITEKHNNKHYLKIHMITLNWIIINN